MPSSIVKAVMECSHEHYSWMRQRKNYAGSMTILVERMILAFMDTRGGKYFIGLKWLEILLIGDGMYEVSGTSQRGGVFLHSRDLRLETSYLDFLWHDFCHQIACCYEIKSIFSTFYIEGGLLVRRGFNQETLPCLAVYEVMRVFKKDHLGVYSEHQGGSKLFKQLINLDYYWPTLEVDATFWLKVPSMSTQ